MGVRRFFQRRSQDSDLARELDAHLAHQVDENIAAGMTEEEARRQAYLKLGNPQQVREKVWQWNTVKFFEHLVQDLIGFLHLNGFRKMEEIELVDEDVRFSLPSELMIAIQ